MIEEYKKERERLKKWEDFRENELENLEEKQKKIIKKIGKFLGVEDKTEFLEGNKKVIGFDKKNLIFRKEGIKTSSFHSDRNWILKKLKNYSEEIGLEIGEEEKMKKVGEILERYEEPPEYEYEIEIIDISESVLDRPKKVREKVKLEVEGSSTYLKFRFKQEGMEIGEYLISGAWKQESGVLRLSQINVEGIIKRFKKDWKRIGKKYDEILKKLGELNES